MENLCSTDPSTHLSINPFIHSPLCCIMCRDLFFYSLWQGHWRLNTVPTHTVVACLSQGYHLSHINTTIQTPIHTYGQFNPCLLLHHHCAQVVLISCTIYNQMYFIIYTVPYFRSFTHYLSVHKLFMNKFRRKLAQSERRTVMTAANKEACIHPRLFFAVLAVSFKIIWYLNGSCSYSVCATLC